MATKVSGSLLRSQRVAPSTVCSDVIPSDGNKMIELRNNRRLHLLHLNQRPRDVRFQQEMVLYLQYRKHGQSVAGGPLVMPRRQAQTTQNHERNTTITPQYLRNTSTHPVPLDKAQKSRFTGTTEPPHIGQSHEVLSKVIDLERGDTEIIPTYDGPTVSGTSSLLSSPSHAASVSGNTRSASSVLLALHNQEKTSQGMSSLPIVPDYEDLEFKLQLSAMNDQNQQASRVNGPMSPLSPHTQANDASVCQDLYVSKPEKDSAVTSIADAKSQAKSMSAPTATTITSDTDLVMFFIHGVGGSSNIWKGQTEYFASLGYEIIAPDFIGHGLSDSPHDKKAYHFKEIAADLEEIFDNFCKRRNILIGHSYGASFATLLARTRARRVTRLVLVSGGPPSPLAPQPGVFTLPPCLLACFKPCLTRGFYKGAFTPKADQSNLSVPKKSAFHIHTRVLRHTMNGQDWPDGDELYHNWLTCPTLLLFGEMDGLVSLSEEQEMQRAIFDSRLVVIPEASHMVMMEAPEQVNEFILNFMLHPSPPTCAHHKVGGHNEVNDNSSNSEGVQAPIRSKSSKSLRSSKTPRTPKSRPQRLLSKSVIL